MCGIYGVINKFTFDEVVSKISKTNYRGPDFTGVKKINENIYFAHNRLAIIDLDNRSNQPFTYESCTVVFNGEIYNYLEIKSELITKGYKFTTNSDTEVLCALYLEKGVDCLSQFNGMFSFVLFDEKKNTLFGARDRLGKKPLYYIYNSKNRNFEFSSQLSPLILGNNLNISWENVSEYFFWGYNQDPNTPFVEVKKIPSGNFFTYDIDKNNFTLNQYWNQVFEPIKKSVDFETAKFELKSLIIDSVKIRSNSDVPLGVFLSGGIDSSLVSSVAQENSIYPIKTFSISFLESKYDEGKYSKLIAAYLGTDHYEFVCNFQDAISFVENFEDYIDEPIADMSTIPMLLLSSKTKEKVSVAMSGDGGDEIFAGYDRYQWMRNSELYYKNIPFDIRRSVSRIISLFPGYKLGLINKGLSQKNLFELYCKMVGILKPSVFNIDSDYIYNNVSKYWGTSNSELIEKLCLFDIKTYLNNNINTKVDRSTMRFSLEARAPLMDFRIVENSFRIPLHFKNSKGNSKLILKEILYDYIPPKFFDRPKSGFAMPLKEWFKGDLKEFVMDYITKENLDKIPVVNNMAVFDLVREHMSGKGNHALELWKIIVWIKFQKSLDVINE